MSGEVANFQIINAIVSADATTAFIYLVLVFYSVWSWSIVFDKFFKFRLLKIKTEKFDKLFWSGVMLEDIYKQIKNNATYPSAVIFSAVMQEWESSNVLTIVQNNDSAKKESLKERLSMIMDVAMIKSMTKIKYGMTFLTIVSSTATLFGLFGTVWGLIMSFSKVAMMQDSSLVVIAPGIAASLATTFIGLIAAVPAAIFHLYYDSKINNFEDKMTNFCSDVLTILSRELDQ
jgi:biopolymer transport protein TolQ